MSKTSHLSWVVAANAAAVRLAAEAGAEVDEIFESPEGASLGQLHRVLATLEQGAEPIEVATDLAGLLWAECEDVPPIATIVEEPSAQASLLAVIEARRLAARRVATKVEAVEKSGGRRPVSAQFQALTQLAALDPARAHLWRRPGLGQRRS